MRRSSLVRRSRACGASNYADRLLLERTPFNIFAGWRPQSEISPPPPVSITEADIANARATRSFATIVWDKGELYVSNFLSDGTGGSRDIYSAWLKCAHLTFQTPDASIAVQVGLDSFRVPEVNYSTPSSAEFSSGRIFFTGEQSLSTIFE